MAVKKDKDILRELLTLTESNVATSNVYVSEMENNIKLLNNEIINIMGYRITLFEAIDETKSSFPTEWRQGWVKILIYKIIEYIKKYYKGEQISLVLNSKGSDLPVIPFLKYYKIRIEVGEYSFNNNYIANFQLLPDDIGLFNVKFNLCAANGSLNGMVANFVYHEFLHAYEKYMWYKKGKGKEYDETHNIGSYYQSIKNIVNFGKNRGITSYLEYFECLSKVLYFLSPIEQKGFISQAISNIESGEYGIGSSAEERDKIFLGDLWRTTFQNIQYLSSVEDTDLKYELANSLKMCYPEDRIPVWANRYSTILKHLKKTYKYLYRIFCLKVNSNLANKVVDNYMATT